MLKVLFGIGKFHTFCSVYVFKISCISSLIKNEESAVSCLILGLKHKDTIQS